MAACAGPSAVKVSQTRLARVCSSLNDEHARAWNVQWADAHRNAATFEVEGITVPTASIEDLIESKRTGRLQDAADIEVLEEIRRLRGR